MKPTWTKRFRRWNGRLTLKAYSGLMVGMPRLEISKAIMRHSPYRWMALMVPIAGIAFLGGLEWEWDLYFREKRLRERHARR